MSDAIRFSMLNGCLKPDGVVSSGEMQRTGLSSFTSSLVS